MKTPVEPETVAQAYGRLIEQGVIEPDEAQKALVVQLDALREAIGQAQSQRKSSALGWLLAGNRKPGLALKGLYIHGKVGRGKSMLMDIFHAVAPVNRKRRAHFNDFMADVHERIKAQREAFKKGETRETDPIGPVGRAIAKDAQLLCFDEFTVTDIADAMILGRLFEVLFDKGVVLVATSNVALDDLYEDGLNRQLFLPFIAMLRTRCGVFELDAAMDFRLDKLSRGQAYLSPLTEKTERSMETIWTGLTQGSAQADAEFRIKGRKFMAKRAAGKSCWFTFDQLCRQPHGAADYLAIAERFDTVFIEGVPMMEAHMRNEAKRFILLIDTLYDKSLRTIVSADANPHALYLAASGREAFEFQRTISRLIEMQSHAYLERFEQTHSN